MQSLHPDFAMRMCQADVRETDDVSRKHSMEALLRRQRQGSEYEPVDPESFVS